MYISDQWKIPVSCRDYWRDIYFPTCDDGNLSINPKYSGTSLPQCFLAEMYSLWVGLDSVGGTVTRSVWGHMKNSHTNNDTSVIWFGSKRAQSKHQCPVHLQWNHLTLKLNHRKHITYGKVCLQCSKFTPNTKCTTFSPKLRLGKTLGGEFKLLCIRELDNDDVDVKPDSTDEDSPPILHTSALANELWCSVERTLVALDEIHVNVMQTSVVYWKWPNVVDIYCKRADAIKRTY